MAQVRALQWAGGGGHLGSCGPGPPQGSEIPRVCFQNQLLTKGMVILRDKIRFYEGEWCPRWVCRVLCGVPWAGHQQMCPQTPGLGGLSGQEGWKGSGSRAEVCTERGLGERLSLQQGPSVLVTPVQGQVSED